MAGWGELDQGLAAVRRMRPADDQALLHEQPDRPGHGLGAYPLVRGEVAGGHGAVAVEGAEDGDLAVRDPVLVLHASRELAHRVTQFGGDGGGVRGGHKAL